jgi:hypothetical protein
MKKKTISLSVLSSVFVLSIASFAFAADYPAEWEGWQHAEKIVKNPSCSESSTIDQYLTKKAEIPEIENLEWNVYPRKDGFEVERLLLPGQRLSLEHRRHVDRTGKAC